METNPQNPNNNPLINALKFGFFEIIFVIVLLIILFGTLNYFHILQVSKSLPFLSFLPQQTQSEKSVDTPIKIKKTMPILNKNNNTINLPIDPKDPAVVMGGASYVLQGTIYSVAKLKNKDNEWKLTLTGKGGNTFFDIQLILTKDTPIASVSPGKVFNLEPQDSKKLSPFDLKTSDKIVVHYYYDLNEKKGQVTSLSVEK